MKIIQSSCLENNVNSLYNGYTGNSGDNLLYTFLYDLSNGERSYRSHLKSLDSSENSGIFLELLICDKVH